MENFDIKILKRILIILRKNINGTNAREKILCANFILGMAKIPMKKRDINIVPEHSIDNSKILVSEKCTIRYLPKTMEVIEKIFKINASINDVICGIG